MWKQAQTHNSKTEKNARCLAFVCLKLIKYEWQIHQSKKNKNKTMTKKRKQMKNPEQVLPFWLSITKLPSSFPTVILYVMPSPSGSFARTVATSVLGPASSETNVRYLKKAQLTSPLVMGQKGVAPYPVAELAAIHTAFQWRFCATEKRQTKWH